MKKEIDLLETAVQEIDYLFQEGVICSRQDKDRLVNLVGQLSAIANDPFFCIESLPKP